ETGCIYIARGGGDMSVSTRGGVLMALPKPESNSHAWHPSADILVNSALEHLAPKQLIGVLLTGMGTDGAESMTRLKQAGGRTIAESEETAVIYGMPRELAERGGATLILPAQKIAAQLSNWLL
ncbi:MAG: CheB methylesterase domain-containing protein, partial [Iodobacter sp.]